MSPPALLSVRRNVITSVLPNAQRAFLIDPQYAPGFNSGRSDFKPPAVSEGGIILFEDNTITGETQGGQSPVFVSWARLSNPAAALPHVLSVSSNAFSKPWTVPITLGPFVSAVPDAQLRVSFNAFAFPPAPIPEGQAAVQFAGALDIADGRVEVASNNAATVTPLDDPLPPAAGYRLISFGPVSTGASVVSFCNNTINEEVAEETVESFREVALGGEAGWVRRFFAYRCGCAELGDRTKWCPTRPFCVSAVTTNIFRTECSALSNFKNTYPTVQAPTPLSRNA